MSLYHCKVEGIVTGAVANTFTTLLGLKFADTLGHRAKLRKLVIGGGGGAPQDLQVSLRLRKTDITADGTSTAVNVNTIGKADPTAVASNVAAIGKTYTVEPTTMGTDTLGGAAMNTRGGVVLEWPGDDAPTWGRKECLCLEGAPGEAVAAKLEVYACWEE